MTYLLIALIAAVLANDTLRSKLFGLVLSLFGETQPEPLKLAHIETTDTADYADGVYEVHQNGFRTITWLSGSQVRNMLAFNMTLAYQVDLA